MMNFGEALQLAKQGEKIQREGWDPHLFVYKKPDSEIENISEIMQMVSHSMVSDFYRRFPKFKHTIEVIYCGYFLAFEHKERFLEYWSPNYEDMFSKDWRVMN